MSQGMASKNDKSMQNDEIELRIANEKSHWIDSMADYLSDWLSPILVKETRQALKSRHSSGLFLCCCWRSRFGR